MNSDMLGDKNKGFVVESADYNFSGIPEANDRAECSIALRVKKKTSLLDRIKAC
jgi:hypothetical protein